MNLITFQQLHQDGFISDDSLAKVETLEKNRLFSLHWELKTLLYLGVTLLSGGLGILVYKNIDTIGHQVILAFIASVSIGCFFYCGRKAAPFSLRKVQSPNPFFDYILLLGCLTMLTFVAYLQYAYSAFGEHYGLATFIPMVILFFGAYSFDHLGVLSLAITNLAAWMGIAITPLRILTTNYFEDSRLIYAGLALGILLLLAAAISEKRNIKKHFEFTYRNFGTHIIFIATLAGMFTNERFYLSWFLLLLAIAVFVYSEAMKKNSFYFLLLSLLYTYLGLSWVVIQILYRISLSDGVIMLGCLYFILSAIGLIRLLMVFNHKMKANDRV
ncbi:MAG TPA: DUF2157 domain-containing protein [Chitinophagaceae bacterium]|jgi:hypothetical protein